MKHFLKAASAFGLAVSLGLVGVSETFAKAHDQGVGDLTPPPGGRALGSSNEGGSSFITDLDPSFADRQNGNFLSRGDISSGAQGGNSGTHGDNAGEIDDIVH